MGRRGHHEGSYFQRKDGRWVAEITVKDAYGRTKRVTRYAQSKTDARARLKELQRQLEDGVQLTERELSVKKFLERWLESSVKPSVRPKTFEGYESIVRRRVVPWIGHLKLRRVTPMVLQELYGDLLKSGLTARSVVHTHRCLHRAFEQAVRWGLVSWNPCDRVDPPQPKRPEMTVLNKQQVETLLEATRDDRYHALYVLAVTTGMRIGELLGLKWEDIDLEGRKLGVRRALQRQKGRGLIFTEPKTSRARRGVILSRQAVAALQRHRAQQLQDRLLAGSAWKGLDLVFANATGGPLDPSWQTARFKEVLDQAGLPKIRFHDLRHTAATLLLSRGVHPKVVSEMLGHATITLTLDTYSHLVPVLHEEAAEQMDALFGG